MSTGKSDQVASEEPLFNEDVLLFLAIEVTGKMCSTGRSTMCKLEGRLVGV